MMMGYLYLGLGLSLGMVMGVFFNEIGMLGGIVELDGDGMVVKFNMEFDGREVQKLLLVVVEDLLGVFEFFGVKVGVDSGSKVMELQQEQYWVFLMVGFLLLVDEGRDRIFLLLMFIVGFNWRFGRVSMIELVLFDIFVGRFLEWLFQVLVLLDGIYVWKQ